MAQVLETPEKEPQALARSCPKCGNIFKEDSNFCRRCGVKRARLSADSPPESGEHMSPFTWMKRVLTHHSDEPAKRPRHFESDLHRRLVTVVDEVSSDASCDAESMVLRAECTALATPKKSRNGFENEACGILGKTLTKKKQALQSDITEKEKKRAAGDAAVKVAETNKAGAARAVEEAKEGFNSARKAVSDIAGRKKPKDEEMSHAHAALTTAQGNLKTAQHELEEVEDLYSKNFVVLKEGTAGGKSAEDKLLRALLPHLEKWGGEDCLLAGFTPAVHHQKTARGAWCTKVVDAVELLFNKPRDEAKAKVAEAQKAVDSASQECERIKRESDLLAKELAKAEARQTEASSSVSAKEAELSKAEGLLASSKAELAVLVDNLDSSKSKLQSFDDGVMADFQWLSDHNEAEGDTLDHATLTSLLQIKHHHVPDSLDDKGEARVKKVRDKLEDPSAVTGDISKRTLAMLSDLAGGAVGPSAADRKDAQKAGADMIRRALRSRQSSLLAQLDKAAKDAKYSAEQLQQFKGAEGPKLLEEELASKAKLVERAEDAQKKACGAAVDTAEVAEKEAAQKYSAMSAEAKAAEDAFKEHFLPLKDGSCASDREVRQHLSACNGLLESWKCEDCLVAGFAPAAGHKPDVRGTWCKKVMEEIEKMFKAETAKAAGKLATASSELNAKKQELADAKARCSEAKNRLAAAQKEHQDVQQLQSSVLSWAALRSEIESLLEGNSSQQLTQQDGT
eukprot:CAMPEP_0178438336 /NCGR_PEP_ID=MMETSP0689_2-20121128/35537_1 /TAXON_ID=160604 /ORGANISM="Amphidinium massartii, Strain CS-259" /LENGTH=738 /DNA_ID=CAMNT_0020060729 /DNA_START=22 /DNA_END=2239 /DNA_ORIENTATION=-